MKCVCVGGGGSGVYGGVSAKKIKCVGGASRIFSSPSPPGDFKWNSPKDHAIVLNTFVILLSICGVA